MDEEIRQEGASIERVVPVDLTRVINPEAVLHDDRPNVYTDVEDHDCEETELGTTTLADALEIENEAEPEASDDTEEG